MNFEKIADICSTILIICDFSNNLDYEINKDYRSKKGFAYELFF